MGFPVGLGVLLRCRRFSIVSFSEKGLRAEPYFNGVRFSLVVKKHREKEPCVWISLFSDQLTVYNRLQFSRQAVMV